MNLDPKFDNMFHEGHQIYDKEDRLRGPVAKKKSRWSDRIETVVEESGELAVTHSEDLKYLHYLKVEPGYDNVPFEMYVSDEAKDIIRKIGWKRLRRALEEEFHNIDEDPQGEQSIDPGKDDEQARKQRTVNRLSEELEQSLGVPIAIKGTGEYASNNDNRESLTRQFVRMRTLEAAMPKALSPEQQAIFKVCKVFAVINYKVGYPKGDQEWLIMERVPNAQQVKDVKYGSGSGESDIGFDPKEHPRLAHLFGEKSIRTWQGLKKKFYEHKLELTDFNKSNFFGYTGTGRNILWNLNNNGEKVYTLIDQ